MNEITSDGRRPVAYKNEAFLSSPDARMAALLHWLLPDRLFDRLLRLMNG